MYHFIPQNRTTLQKALAQSRQRTFYIFLWFLQLSLFLFLASSVQAHLGVHQMLNRLNKQIRKHPKQSHLYIQRSELYRQHLDISKSLTDLQIAQRISPEQNILNLHFALTWFAADKLKRSQERLEWFMLCGKEHWQAWSLHAQLAQKQKRWKQSINSYSQAIYLGATPELYLKRGKLQEFLGQWRSAAQGYHQGMKELGSALVLRLALLHANLHLKNHKQALHSINQMLQKVPLKADWWLRRAKVYDAMKRPSLAEKDRIKALRETLSFLKVRPNTYNKIRLVRIYLALGQKNKAKKLLLLIHKQFPKLPEMIQLKKQLLLKMGTK